MVHLVLRQDRESGPRRLGRGRQANRRGWGDDETREGEFGNAEDEELVW